MRRQSRFAYVGMERRTGCVPAGGWCDRPDGDCRACPRLPASTWICAFCVAESDQVTPGAYSTGQCERCRQDRILLMRLMGV